MKPVPPLLDEVARALFTKHDFASYDAAGRCVRAGYVVEAGTGGAARVSHRIPEPDLLDPDRPTDAELAEERARMVARYAEALKADGWAVRRRVTGHTRKPILLVTRPKEK